MCKTHPIIQTPLNMPEHPSNMAPHFIAATLQNLRMLIMTYTFLFKEAKCVQDFDSIPCTSVDPFACDSDYPSLQSFCRNVENQQGRWRGTHFLIFKVWLVCRLSQAANSSLQLSSSLHKDIPNFWQTDQVCPDSLQVPKSTSANIWCTAPTLMRLNLRRCTTKQATLDLKWIQNSALEPHPSLNDFIVTYMPLIWQHAELY